MNTKIKIATGTVALAAAMMLGASSASAAVTFDSATGTGFVGKGDVQLALNWNNKQLQDNAKSVDFKYVAEETTVTEVSWFCTNTSNQKIQEREKTTTTTTTINDVVTNVTRERNQVTGFTLTGYQSAVPTEKSTSDGPGLNTCPSGPWTLTTPAGDPVVLEDQSTSTADLFLVYNGTQVKIG